LTQQDLQKKIEIKQLEIMKLQIMNESYPIFCIAAQLLKDRDNEIDLVWSDAVELYAEFILSEFNDSNKSEIECINNFLNNKNN